MTPIQKIEQWIMCGTSYDGVNPAVNPGDITEDNVDDLFNEGEWDINDFRFGDIETGLPTPTSRHYVSKSVAAKMCDGSWVGWTYWYGGGKHGEPDAMPWMENAYDLEVTEEEKLVTVRTFKKKGMP